MRITTTTGSVYRQNYMSRELSIGELSEKELHTRIASLKANRLTQDRDIECWELELSDLEAELEDRQSPRRSGW